MNLLVSMPEKGMAPLKDGRRSTHSSGSAVVSMPEKAWPH